MARWSIYPMDFECHINVRGGISPDDLRNLGRNYGWKFSCIADKNGEPLDNGIMFLTMHGPEFDSVLLQARTLRALIESRGGGVVRLKIEQIVYDEVVGTGVVV